MEGTAKIIHNMGAWEMWKATLLPHVALLIRELMKTSVVVAMVMVGKTHEEE